MGAQQVKSDNRLISQKGKHLQKCTENMISLPVEQKPIDEIPKKAVMSKRNLSPNSITVADFAKIKIESQSTEECLNDSQAETPKQKVKCENTAVFCSTGESLETEINISLPDNAKICQELNSVSRSEQFLNLSNVLVKKELLELCGVESSSKATKEVDCEAKMVLPLCDESSDEICNQFCSAIKTEVTADYSHLNAHLESSNIADTTEKDKKKLNLVKNPLAFRKKNHGVSVKMPMLTKNINQYQQTSLNNISLESNPIILIDEELEVTRDSKSPLSAANSTENKIFKEEGVESTLNINELIIKSEYIGTPEVNQQIYNNNTSSNQVSVNYNSNSSLYVNPSDVDTYCDESLFKHSNEDATSHISINSSSTSLQYFSVVEVSSVENDNIPVEKSEITKNIKNLRTPKAYKKSNLSRTCNKLRRKRKLNNSNQGKRQKKDASKTVGKKRYTKTNQSRKYKEKDSAFKSQLPKNLPKSGIKTRKKAIKAADNKKNTIGKEVFPKPFKLEPATISCKDHSGALELPKPILVKREFNINTSKSKKSYLRAEFQPCVRLKRLKSEQLLVPLQTKVARKKGNFNRTTNSFGQLSYHRTKSDKRPDFHIHQAFSLNPCIKFNRSIIDRQYSFSNDQSSTLNSMSTDRPNESLVPRESKYFSAQELHSLLHSSTPDASSLFSNHIDSGASTSTPSISAVSNKTLLLKIAAERAFINNHLMNFGYSPIQFDLYNNLNDLRIFLKYLFGKVNRN